MKRRGFSLIEIMVVVALIMIISAIALPNFLRSRRNANEGAAVATMRTLSTACESFMSTQNPNTYPASLAELGAANPPYIDSVLASGTKQGYNYAYSRTDAEHFTCTATPASNTRGTRIFFVDESGVIRINNAQGPPIE